MKKRVLRRREGFTLIELLIVLAIIGALMAIGIPIYTNSLESAKATAVASNIRSIADGVRTNYMLNGEVNSKAISDYINVEDPGDYSIATSTTTDKYIIKVGYHGSVSASKVKDKLKGCSSIESDSNAATCVMELSKSF